MLCGTVVGLELTGQGVWFDIPCTWAIRQGEVKAIKEQRPSGLTGVQPFGRPDVLEVLVVCPYNKRMFCPLQPVPSFLESQLDSQYVPVSDVIISFCWGQFAGEKGTRM